MPRGKRASYSVRCQAYIDSATAKLFSYLKSDEIELTSEQEMIIAPVAACWLPYAQKYHRDVPEAELKQCARRARRRLNQFIFNLEQDFGLEPLEKPVCPKEVVEPFAELWTNLRARPSTVESNSKSSEHLEFLESEPNNRSAAVHNHLADDDIGGEGEWDDSGL